MFQFDSDSIFESMNIEDFNSNQNIIGLGQIKDLEDTHFIPEPAAIYSDIMPDSFFSQNSTAEAMECTPQAAAAVVAVKQEETSNINFDLIKFVMGEVSDTAEIENLENDFNQHFFTSKQDDCFALTPLEEKSEPIFDVVVKAELVDVVAVKQEPSPSTSKAASPTPEFTANVRTSERRKAPKRRYSSDSDFSISTSASSFNTSSKRQKKRGRPAKELITDLPTVEDYDDLPREEASHLVNRIKNNEASRKSRMKSKSKQDAMEDECSRLMRRRRVLEVKRNKYEGQIETLRRWLLGQN